MEIKNNHNLFKSRKEFAFEIINILHKHSYKAYLVGGCVRDMVLNIETNDYDIVTNATPNDIKKLFKKTLDIGSKFGIIMVIKNNHKFEVASFRKDGEYSDGRRPNNIVFCDEKEDVYRRDFTINGLLYDFVNNKIIDYVNGIEDINNKIINTIGIPYDRFSEDYLRMIRAIRFASKLNFKINPAVWDAIIKLAKNITTISSERIYEELKKILNDKNRAKGIEYLFSSKIFKYIMPNLYKKYNSKKISNLIKIISQLPIEYNYIFVFSLFYLVVYLNIHNIETNSKYNFTERLNKFDFIEIDCSNLRFSNIEMNTIKEIIQTSFLLYGSKSYNLWELKRLFRSNNIKEIIQINKILSVVLELNKESVIYCEKKLSEFKKSEIFIEPLINGNDLINIGYKPGKIFKEILKEVENKQLENIIINKEQAINYIKKKLPN